MSQPTKAEIVKEQTGIIRSEVYAHYGAACHDCGRTHSLGLYYKNGKGTARHKELGLQGRAFWLYLKDNNYPASKDLILLCSACHGGKQLKRLPARVMPNGDRCDFCGAGKQYGRLRPYHFDKTTALLCKKCRAKVEKKRRNKQKKWEMNNELLGSPVICDRFDPRTANCPIAQNQF